MATNLEITVYQKNRLFMLLEIEKENKEQGVVVFGLRRRIIAAEAEMQQEDVAFVREKIAMLYNLAQQE